MSCLSFRGVVTWVSCSAVPVPAWPVCSCAGCAAGSGTAVGDSQCWQRAIVDVMVMPSDAPAVIAMVEVRYRHTEPVTYWLPLTVRLDPEAEVASAEAGRAVIARLSGGDVSATLLDGSQVPGVFELLASGGHRTPAPQDSSDGGHGAA